MATSTIAEAKRYLFRYGCNTDTTIDPVDLVRDLVAEYEKLEDALKPKRDARGRFVPQLVLRGKP